MKLNIAYRNQKLLILTPPTTTKSALLAHLSTLSINPLPKHSLKLVRASIPRVLQQVNQWGYEVLDIYTLGEACECGGFLEVVDEPITKEKGEEHLTWKEQPVMKKTNDTPASHVTPAAKRRKRNHNEMSNDTMSTPMETTKASISSIATTLPSTISATVQAPLDLIPSLEILANVAITKLTEEEDDEQEGQSELEDGHLDLFKAHAEHSAQDNPLDIPSTPTEIDLIISPFPITSIRPRPYSRNSDRKSLSSFANDLLNNSDSDIPVISDSDVPSASSCDEAHSLGDTRSSDSDDDNKNQKPNKRRRSLFDTLQDAIEPLPAYK